MSLYFMSYSAMTQAVTNLTDEIQQFLLDIGQEEYTITILNGVKWILKMNQYTLATLRDHKYKVALRRSINGPNNKKHAWKKRQT